MLWLTTVHRGPHLGMQPLMCRGWGGEGTMAGTWGSGLWCMLVMLALGRSRLMNQPRLEFFLSAEASLLASSVEKDSVI